MKLNFSDRGFWLGTAYCVLAALAWAIIGPVSRVCLCGRHGACHRGVLRMAISGVCFLIHAMLVGGLHAGRRDLVSMMLFGAINVSLVILSLQISIQKSGGAIAHHSHVHGSGVGGLFPRAFCFMKPSTRLRSRPGAGHGGHQSGLSFGRKLGREVSYVGIGCGLLSGFTYAFQFCSLPGTRIAIHAGRCLP